MASSNQASPPPPETLQVDTSPAACDGGGGALGHPLIYIPLAEGRGECGYCDRVFVLKPGARPSH